MRRLLLIASLLGLSAEGGYSLQCYACSSHSGIDNGNLSSQLKNLIDPYPDCDEFDAEDPEERFIQTCPIEAQKGCLKFTDPNDDDNVIRSCFMKEEDKCTAAACYCTTDLCNGSVVSTLSSHLALVVAIVVAIKSFY